MKKLLSTSALGLRLLLPIFILPTFPAVAYSNDQIEEVMVSASLIPIAANRSANAITVIDSEQLKLRAALSVSDLLRDVPGLAVSRSGVQGSQTQIRARGSEANHLLVLIDGIEANDPSQSDELNWGTLSTDDIERIEVIRGPQSSMRGSDAVAGVVNITTRGAEQPFSAKLYTEAGSFSTQRSGFSVGATQGNFTVRLGVSDIETDGDNISRTGDEKDGYKNTNVNIKAGYAASESLTLSLSARQSDGMNEFDSDDDWDGLVEDRDRVSEFRNSTVGLQANYVSVDGRWQHKLLLAKSKHDNEAFADGEKGNETASTKDQYQYVGSMFWNDGAQRISILAEREQEDFQQLGPLTSWGADPNQDRERDTDSFAVEYRTGISDSLSFALSSRYDDNSEFDSANTHRVEAVFQLDDSTRLRAAYGTAVKNPTFFERFGTYTNFIGNPNLEPEESTSWEAGIDQQIGDLSLSATLFDAKLENEINGFFYDAVNFGFTAVNREGRSKRQGAELKAAMSIDDSISINAAYTYTDSVEPDSDGVLKDEIRRARHTASFNLAWQIKDNLTVNANAQHNGKQTDIGDVTLDAFTLVNLNASYSASDQLDIYLRVDNLLDEDYEEVFGYQTLGFGANMGLRYKF